MSTRSWRTRRCRYFKAWIVAGASVDATLRTRSTVSPLWGENTQLVVAEESVGRVAARGGFLGGDDDTTIFTSMSLDGTITVTVPSGRFLMLEASLVTGWKIDSGNFGSTPRTARSVLTSRSGS